MLVNEKIIIKKWGGLLVLFEIVKDNREYILIILFIKKMVKMLIFFLPDQNFIFSLFFCRRAPQNAGKGMSKCRSLISFFSKCALFFFLEVRIMEIMMPFLPSLVLLT